MVAVKISKKKKEIHDRKIPITTCFFSLRSVNINEKTIKNAYFFGKNKTKTLLKQQKQAGYRNFPMMDFLFFFEILTATIGIFR